MSTIISSFGSGTTNIASTALSVPVTALAGDLIVINIPNVAVTTSGLWSTFTWNGQQLSVISVLGIAGTTKALNITVAGIAATSGTFNLTASKTTSHNLNYSGHVIRATKGFLGLPTVKTQIWDSSASGSLGAFAQPTLTSDALGTNGRVIDFLHTLGLSNSSSDARPTSVVATGGATLLNNALHSNQTINALDSSTLVGSGAVTTGYTISYTTNAPCFYYVQLSVREVQNDITFFAANSAWANSNVAASLTLTAPRDAQSLLYFVAADAAITGNTVSLTNVTVNGAAATIVTSSPINVDGNGYVHWVYRFDNIVPGTSYTITETSATLVHENVAVFVCCPRPVLITAGAYSRGTSTGPSVTATTVAGDAVLFGLSINSLNEMGLSRTDDHYTVGENGDATRGYNGVTVKEATGTTTTATFVAASSQKWCAVPVICRKITQAANNILIKGWARNVSSPKYDGAAVNGGH